MVGDQVEAFDNGKTYTIDEVRKDSVYSSGHKYYKIEPRTLKEGEFFLKQRAFDTRTVNY
jgi:hypothetical protein